MRTIFDGVRNITLAVCLTAWTAGAKAELKPGMVLNQDTWQQAEGLLPPEVLKHYQNGDYANAIVDWPDGLYTWPPDFKAASEKNAGQLDVDDNGMIIEKGSNKQPPYVMGFPFPIIDPADPKAGTKIVWNYFYRLWYLGSLRAETQLNWVSPRNLERRADLQASFEQYDGVPPDERLSNPSNFSVRILANTTSPADLNGTAALTWRYRDSDKRDSNWAYVPALRRVRAVSPANRSDGFLGSDMSQDDGQFFDGKPEDFTWVLKGESDQLRFVDPFSLKGEAEQVWLPSGGWRANWPDLKFLGYMDPAWKGTAWAPIAAVLAKRPFWVVEGTPKDKYYLFGRIQLYIDKETFQGAWNRKFSWQGELLNTLQVMAFLLGKFTRPDGKVDYNQASSMAFQCAENIQSSQATVAGIKSNPKSGFDYRVDFPATSFDVSSLGRAGK